MIDRLAVHFPERVVTNQELACQFPDWPAEKILAKTGIEQRHIVAENECASDLAYAAGLKLFDGEEQDLDWLLFCTQSPDFKLPTSACLLQKRLGLSTSCAAVDFNQGCSGYVYGLSLGSALISSGQAQRVLLLTADTYSKYLHPEDKSTRTIFGDAGTATLLTKTSNVKIHSFVLGSDGNGENHLIVRGGGARPLCNQTSDLNQMAPDCLYMNGPEVFNFTIKAVPKLVESVLQKADLEMSNIDWVIFHQANGYMLEHLRRKIGIPKEKFAFHFSHCGNTVSSTIPIVLEKLLASEHLERGMKLLLVGFGVGFSWGGCVIEW